MKLALALGVIAFAALPPSNVLDGRTSQRTNDASTPVTRARDERRIATPSELAPLVAAIEAASASQDDAALIRALDAVVAFDNRELLDVHRRLLTAAPSPGAVERATATLAAAHPSTLSAGAEEAPTEEELADAVRRFESWREVGLEVWSHREAAAVSVKVCEYFSARGDEASFDVLVRALANRDVCANPYRTAQVVKTLARFEQTSRKLDDALCDLIHSVAALSDEQLALTDIPPLRLGLSASVHLLPCIEAANSIAVRGTKRRAILESLVEALSLGCDGETDALRLGMRARTDPRTHACKVVGAAASDALLALTGRRYAWGSAQDQAAAKEWIEQRAKSLGFK